MPKRVPLSAIGVTRTINGKNTTVYPEIGKVFDFTDAEHAEIKAIEKASGSTLIRQAKNEDPDGAGTVTTQDGATTKVDLGKLNKAQLQQYAADKQIDLGDASKNAEIVAVIEAEEAKRAEEGGEGTDGDEDL